MGILNSWRDRLLKSLGDADISRGARDVLIERHRQVIEEGWDADHDAQHEPGELASAGSAYGVNAAHVLQGMSPIDSKHELPVGFPWDEEWWKPKDVRSDLVRAAALLIAEIDRLDRAASDQMAITPDWLRNKSANDPDPEICEAGNPAEDTPGDKQ